MHTDRQQTGWYYPRQIEQIASLKAKNSELEARIYYLEMYGGGNSGVTNGDILVLEDKTILTLEDGTVLTFE